MEHLKEVTAISIILPINDFEPYSERKTLVNNPNGMDISKIGQSLLSFPNMAGPIPLACGFFGYSKKRRFKKI